MQVKFLSIIIEKSKEYSNNVQKWNKSVKGYKKMEQLLKMPISTISSTINNQDVKNQPGSGQSLLASHTIRKMAWHL